MKCIFCAYMLCVFKHLHVQKFFIIAINNYRLFIFQFIYSTRFYFFPLYLWLNYPLLPAKLPFYNENLHLDGLPS